MRLIRGFFLFVIVALITFYILEKKEIEPEEAMESISHILLQKKNDFIEKTIPENILADQKLQGEIYHWIGRTTTDLLNEFGEPKRKDLSSYGYTWWVYTNGETQYIQFGIKNNSIQTIYATGEAIEIKPLHIGQDYQSVKEALSFTNQVTYNKGLASYTFQLDDQDIKMRPLVEVANDIFLQAYFDTFTNKLSSIRLMKGDILLTQRPYALRYRGQLPASPKLTEDEWDEIQVGMERQIFDITNIIRHSFNKGDLSWGNEVSEVAFLHSKDMADNNYFSHYSPDGNGLKERLETGDISYMAAGENIAAQYVDAPAAVEGWLNSEGHRESLLNNDYTHLGVGVYRLYYTQDFLRKP